MHLLGDVGQALVDLLESELALSLVTAEGIAGWYWFWRRLERGIPDWLVRLVLGSARTPGHTLPDAVVEIADGTETTGFIPVWSNDRMGAADAAARAGVPLGTRTRGGGVITALTRDEAAMIRDLRLIEGRDPGVAERRDVPPAARPTERRELLWAGVEHHVTRAVGADG